MRRSSPASGGPSGRCASAARVGGAVSVAPRLHRGMRRRRDRASGQRGRHRALERRVRVSGSRARTREPHDHRRHARGPRPAGRRPRGRCGDAAGELRARRVVLAAGATARRRSCCAAVSDRSASCPSGKGSSTTSGSASATRARTCCNRRSRSSSARTRCSWRGHRRPLQQRLRRGRIRSFLLPRPRSSGRGRLE